MPHPVASILSHPHVASPLEGVSVPPVSRRVLSNGLTVLVLEDHAQPLVCLHAVVRTGSASEGPFLGTGVSHVVEHMLFKGTSRRGVGDVEKEARGYGGTTQGFTTYDTTGYEMTVNKEFWSEACDLLIDALFYSTIGPEEFSKERQVVLRELKLRRDDPSQWAWDLLFQNAYRAHPYGVPIIGLEPLVKDLTPEQVRSYYKEKYVPNQMVIAVVGDVQADAVFHRVEELAAGIPPGTVSLPNLSEEPAPLTARRIDETAPVSVGIVAMGFPSVPVHHPDLYALDLLSWILGGGRGSRLERALKENGIVHGVSAWNYTPLHRGLFAVTMRLDPQQAAKALEGTLEEIRKLQRELVPAQELEAVRKGLLLSYLADRQTVGAQASDISTYEVLVGDPAFAAHYQEGMARVSPEEIRRVANDYLRPERLTQVLLLPQEAGVAQGSPPAASLKPPVVEKKVSANGLTVLLRQDQRLPMVTFQISMLGGARYETSASNGVSALTSRMLLRGTGHKTSQEIVDQVKSMGGELNSFSGRNSVGLTLSVVRAEAGSAAELLAELLLESTFPAQELEKEKRLLLAQLKTQEEDPFGWGIKRLSATLFTVHPYQLDPSGDPQVVAAVNPKDVAAFYSRIRDPKKMVVAVAGDFDREELLRIFTQKLGSVRPESPASFQISPEPPLTSLREHEELSSRKEALIMIGFPGLKVSDPRVATLDLIETILSGGAGRLFTQVRERRGLAYTVGAFGVHGVDPGFFSLYAVVEPQQVEPVRQALLEEVRRLGAGPVSEEELRFAKQGLLGARRIARQTQTALAAQISLDELYGLGFDFPEKYEAWIQKVGPQDIQILSQELLDPRRCVTLIGRPQQQASDASASVPTQEEVSTP